jgi:hypothetical protein
MRTQQKREPSSCHRAERRDQRIFLKSNLNRYRRNHFSLRKEGKESPLAPLANPHQVHHQLHHPALTGGSTTRRPLLESQDQPLRRRSDPPSQHPLRAFLLRNRILISLEEIATLSMLLDSRSPLPSQQPQQPRPPVSNPRRSSSTASSSVAQRVSQNLLTALQSSGRSLVSTFT